MPACGELLLAANDRGCVKTQTKTGLRKIDASERATLNDRGLGNSKRTPENIPILRFYTAWAERGPAGYLPKKC